MDLETKLREAADVIERGGGEWFIVEPLREAAKLIARQAAEIERKDAALRKIVEERHILGHFAMQEIARAALAPAKDE